ncbi:hypothetical protein BH09MYX1_BH09MYX1_31230 [soil metagenome]
MRTPLDLLVSLGYEVRFLDDPWVKCIVCLEDECVVAEGLTREQAIANAIRRIFPTRGSRILFERALDASSTPTMVLDEAAEPPASDAATDTAIDEREDRDIGAHAVVAVAAESADDAEMQAEVDVDLDELHVSAALDALDRLHREISDRERSLGMTTPTRQRLTILGWMAQARSVQDAVPHSHVRDRVARIARLLGLLTGRWWPGSIPALKLDATPDDGARALGLPAEHHVTSWASIAEKARAALALHVSQSDARGSDADGWADTRWLLPAPQEPTTFLEDVAASIESVSGSLRSALRRSDERPDPATLLRWARALRWARGAAEDQATWAAAMGRLRFWTSPRSSLMSEVIQALDPTFDPERRWASYFESVAVQPEPVDLERRELEVERLVKAPPARSKADVVRWLREALPLTDTHHAPLSAALADTLDIVAELKPDDFPGMGRRIHRRLRRMQEGDANATLDIPAPISSIELPTAARFDPVVAEEVLAKTRGRRAVFVSNRNDPDLQQRLLVLFAFASLDWAEAEPRRVDALTGAIDRHRYDLVVAATGFMDHTADARIAKACRAGQVPYIRANRGRPGECARAFARDL